MKLFSKPKPAIIEPVFSELYDSPSKLKVQTFYEIMKSGDLNLLKVSPELEADEQLLNDAWLDLTEYYYSKTSKKSFDTFKRNLKQVVAIQAEITSCYAALELVKIYDERGYELLKLYGVNSDNVDAIQSAISRKETKLEFAKNKLDTGNQEEEKVSFLRIVSAIERERGFQLDVDNYSLERWCEMLEDLKAKREAEKQYYNEQKTKRHGR